MGIAIGSVIILATFFFSTVKKLQEKNLGAPRTLAETLIVTADVESRQFWACDSRGNRMFIDCIIQSQTTPFIIHHNGGASMPGGHVELVRAANDPLRGSRDLPADYRTSYLTLQLPAGYPPTQMQVLKIPLD